MKTVEGYSKEKYTDDSVLLAGGGAKALSDFIGTLSWDSTNKKIKYTPVGGSATDLVTLNWDNISGKPSEYPAEAHDHYNLLVSSLNKETDITESGLRCYSGVGSGWTGTIASMKYAAVLSFGNPSRGWQLWAGRTGEVGNGLCWRRGIQAETSWDAERLILDSANYTDYVNTTNFAGLDKTGTVTSITLKAGTGISLDTDNTAITTSGTRTITNSGVRAVSINGDSLRVNTNGTNEDLTISYATNADTLDSYHAKDLYKVFVGGFSAYGGSARWFCVYSMNIGNSSDNNAVFMVTSQHDYARRWGILVISARRDGSSLSKNYFDCIVNCGLDLTHFTATKTTDGTTIKIYVYSTGWSAYSLTRIAFTSWSGASGDESNFYSAHDKTSGFASIPPSGESLFTQTGNPVDKTYAATAGSVSWANVTDKTDYTTRWPSWSEVTGKPDSFTPSSHEHTYIKAKDNYTFTSSTLPKSFDYGVSAGFVNYNSGFGSYGSVLTVRTYSAGGGSFQIYAPYSETYGGTHLKARMGDYNQSSGNSWTSLKTIAWTDDIPTNNNQLTNGAGYITSSGSCAYATTAGSVPTIKSFTFKAGKTYIGWVSIAKLQLEAQNYFNYNSFNFYICREYNFPSSESYSGNLTVGWLNTSIRLLSKSIGSQIINKFRVAIDRTNHFLYLQVYVNTNYTTYENGATLQIAGIVSSWEAENSVNNSLEAIATLDLTAGTYADSAGYATSAGSATSATSATSAASADYATSAGSASSADYATSAGNADTLDNYHLASIYKVGMAECSGTYDYPYHLIAEFTQNNASYQVNTGIILLIKRFYSGTEAGILSIRCRYEGGGTSPSFFQVKWLLNNGITLSHFIGTYKRSSNVVTLRLYAYHAGWGIWSFQKLNESGWNMEENTWSLYNAQRRGSDWASRCFSAIPSGETQQASEYLTISNPISYADSAGTAGSASYADSAGSASSANKVANSLSWTNSSGSSQSFNGSSAVTINGIYTAYNATNATYATYVKTTKSTSAAWRYLTFVDSNNDSAASETVYTNSYLQYYPSSGQLKCNMVTLANDGTTTGGLGITINGGNNNPINASTSATMFCINATNSYTHGNAFTEGSAVIGAYGNGYHYNILAPNYTSKFGGLELGVESSPGSIDSTDTMYAQRSGIYYVNSSKTVYLPTTFARNGRIIFVINDGNNTVTFQATGKTIKYFRRSGSRTDTSTSYGEGYQCIYICIYYSNTWYIAPTDMTN